jgi:D-3-phosphoglycerate dehydrogenase
MKVLITDKLHSSVEQELAVCKQYGFELETTFCHNEEELIKYGQDADAFLVSYSQITRKVLQALPKLKIVVKYGIGVDNIDVQAATDNNVMVANVPDYCLEEVASHALMLIMNGLKQTPFFDRKMQEHEWIRQPNDKILYRPSEISIGLVSFGRIAKTLATYATSIFKKVYFYDPFIEYDLEGNVEKIETLEELFSLCTVISVHTPLMEETRRMIDWNLISRANKTILVNTSRADVIDPEAVIKGLENTNLVFFGADTFWPEPPDFSSEFTNRFLSRSDVLITPHCGWCSLTAEKDVRWKAAETAILGAMGKCPSSVLNKQVCKKSS